MRASGVLYTGVRCALSRVKAAKSTAPMMYGMPFLSPCCAKFCRCAATFELPNVIMTKRSRAATQSAASREPSSILLQPPEADAIAADAQSTINIHILITHIRGAP